LALKGIDRMDFTRSCRILQFTQHWREGGTAARGLR
jgi:hypothetical protein